MANWPIVLLLVASTLALPSGKRRVTRDVYFQPLTYQLVKPAVMLVDTGRGLIATQLHPEYPLRIDDPTNSVLCKTIQGGGHSLFFAPPSYLAQIYKYPQISPILVKNNVHSTKENIPVMLFLKSENIKGVPKNLKKVYLQSPNPNYLWRVEAYMPVDTSSEADVDTEEFLSAPPPIFPALCVSPEKPKPIPILFAPPTQTAVPSTASLSLTDLTPVNISRAPPNPNAILHKPQSISFTSRKQEHPASPPTSLTLQTDSLKSNN